MEKFFKYDLEVKKILFNVAPKEEYRYSKDTLIEYSDKLEHAINDIEYYINSILESFNFFEADKKYFKNYIMAIKNELIKTGYDYNKLKQFYEVCFSDMSEELINKVGSGIKGYYLFSGVSLSEGKSLNEILHIVHQTIVNNENRFNKLPILENIEIGDENFIRLYGRENELAKNIFNMIPGNIDSDNVQIISLSDRILLMIRDYGHALSIEITQENDKYYVNYFIPKICSVNKVNQLRGVKKVNQDSNFTVGSFETTLENLPYELISFIQKVPTDTDIIMERLGRAI